MNNVATTADAASASQEFGTETPTGIQALRNAERLLREAARELMEGVSLQGVPDWYAEPETAAAYHEHIAAADALATLATASPASPLQAGEAAVSAAAEYSLDTDPHGIRAIVSDAITGALAFGAQGVNPPPAGHWLAPFWESARAERATSAGVLAVPVSMALSTGSGDTYQEYKAWTEEANRAGAHAVPRRVDDEIFSDGWIENKWLEAVGPASGNESASLRSQKL